MKVPAARDVLLRPRVVSSEQRAEEDTLFQHLQMPNGTYKTTSHGRLDDLDQWLLDRLDPTTSLELLDVGVSSGATTVDLLEASERRNVSLIATGIDIGMDASIQPLVGGADLLRDSRQRPLQLAFAGLRWARPTNGSHSVRSAIGRLLFRALENQALVSLLSIGEQTPVRLLSMRARNRSHDRFLEHDLFAPRIEWTSRFGLVRAANILHRAYFSDAEIHVALHNLVSFLTTDGLLLIARTSGADSITRGTLFQRTGERALSVADRFNGGCDIEDLITERFVV